MRVGHARLGQGTPAHTRDRARRNVVATYGENEAERRDQEPDYRPSKDSR